MKSNDFHSLGVIYYQMAEFAKKEGKNSDHLIKLGYQMKLRSQENSLFEYQKSGFIKEVVFINTGVNVLTWRESRNKTLFYYIVN